MVIFSLKRHYGQHFQLSGYFKDGWWSVGWKAITEYWLRMVVRVFLVRLFCEMSLNLFVGKIVFGPKSPWFLFIYFNVCNGMIV